MTYRGIMFDLDGTLADTLDGITQAGNHAFESLGGERFDRQRYRYLAGPGLEYLIRTGLGDTAGDEAVTRGMALFRAYYAEHWRETTRPYPGIADLLDALTARHLTLAVLSNKPDAATQEVMSHTFARWRFDAVRGHRDGAPLKPDPAAALDIAAELDIAPDRWLYVGDTDVDMRTGTGAGMFAVGVTWGFRDEAELRESGARAIIADPAALLDWL